MLKLDESAFYRCRLVACHLLYGGGEVVMEDGNVTGTLGRAAYLKRSATQRRARTVGHHDC